MRRLALIFALVLLGVAGGIAANGGGDDAPRYRLELDNAFGVIEGGDVKVAGVRAGSVTEVELDPRSLRALVEIQLDERGFGSLREDVRCEVRPQSLLGEYFIDCLPGTARRVLEPGSLIPVEQTASTIPPDLVLNVMRRPYRERLRLIIGELGAAAAGNADNLNAALRRAVPALRETDRVLAALAGENDQLAAAVENADRLFAALADNRGDVGRFVVETRDTVRATAARSRELATDLRLLPGFLRELTPTMRSLGELAQTGTAPLRDLRANAAGVDRLLEHAGGLADAGRPAVRALGEAAADGVPALRSSRPTVEALRAGVGGFPELAGNLEIIFDHLDDRDNTIERDPRSPGGEGYTGFEAIARWLLYSALTVNAYDGTMHIAKASISLGGRCGRYHAPEDLEEDPELVDCLSDPGPAGPGVTEPDPTRPEGRADRGARRRGERRRSSRMGVPAPGGWPPQAGAERRGGEEALPPLLDNLLHAPPPGPPGQPAPRRDGAVPLLDYLLGP